MGSDDDRVKRECVPASKLKLIATHSLSEVDMKPHRFIRPALAAIITLTACSDSPGSTEPASVQMRPASASLSAVGPHTVGPPASIAFYSGRGGSFNKIYVMNRDGAEQEQITDGPGNDVWPDLSPDGRFLTFASTRSGNNEIYVLSLRDGTLVNVSNRPGIDNWPRWSPNGHRIAFHSDRDGNFNIFTVNPDGTDLRRVTSDPALDQFPDWSPNGKQFTFRRGMDVYVTDADGEEQNVRRLTFLPATLDQMSVWSPNGKQIAFMSVREGYPSVFLMSVDGDTPDHPAVNLTPKDPADPISAWVSRAPGWSKNGRQIYYMSSRPSTGGDVEIFVMNADGTGVTRLTESSGEDGGPRSR